jgi:predicted transcriptional regulator
MGREGVIHVAPPADRLPYLMKELLGWLKTTSAHPLVASSVFHYEFEFVHPFADGNGRMGRLWQTLILSRLNPVFMDIAVEGIIHEHQKDYYSAINQSSLEGDCSPFVKFMLEMILKTVEVRSGGSLAPSRHQVDVLRMCLTPCGITDFMKKAKRSDRTKFRHQVVQPLMEQGLIEMTQPDSPSSPTQKYRLTEKGRRIAGRS